MQTVATAIAAAVEEQAATTREITNNVQQVALTTSTAATAMHDVLSIVEGTDASSRTAATASEVVGRTAETLRSEVTDFLAAMSQGNDAERRLYERIPGGGIEATLQVAGRPGGGTVKARITRKVDGVLGLVFFQDKASLALIDRALGLISGSSEEQAA